MSREDVDLMLKEISVTFKTKGSGKQYMNFFSMFSPENLDKK